jgi:hypothetical protein
MSYAIHPYAVSLPALKKCVGSRDAQLLATLIRKFSAEFDDIDELDEEAVSVERALTQLVMGEKLDEWSGFKYAYGLKFLCEHIGNLLTNRHWSAVGWEWIEDVDKVLSALGIEEKVFRVGSHLSTRGAPIPLPRIVDFPAIGYLLEAEIAKVATELTRVRDADIDDEEIRESVGEIRKWVDHCTRSHKDLVCFYH